MDASVLFALKNKNKSNFVGRALVHARLPLVGGSNKFRAEFGRLARRSEKEEGSREDERETETGDNLVTRPKADLPRISVRKIRAVPSHPCFLPYFEYKKAEAVTQIRS